jgi:hypothetical protein
MNRLPKFLVRPFVYGGRLMNVPLNLSLLYPTLKQAGLGQRAWRGYTEAFTWIEQYIDLARPAALKEVLEDR